MSTKQIVLIQPQYPFGKDHVYLSGSLIAIAARLMAMGHEVKIVDLNIDRLHDTTITTSLQEAELIGISLVGSADIPGVRNLISTLRTFSLVPILLGGQVIERLTAEQFARVFEESAVQIQNDEDLARCLGCAASELPAATEVPYSPVFRSMGENRLFAYLWREATLVVSQGCRYHCRFCAADKGHAERFRDLTLFEADLRYLAEVAGRHGIRELTFYASSLDFFQNPKTVQKYLEAIARVQAQSGVSIRLHCLSRFDSFLKACAEILDLGALCKRAGLWRIGFGADGADPAIWRAQGKENTTSEMLEGLTRCNDMGIHAELLMVFGFPEDTITTLLKAVATSFISVARWWPRVTIKPYLAKETVPGNVGWNRKTVTVNEVVDHPEKFYDLDFCIVGSPLTHPRRFHRWTCNITYLTICAVLLPFGKCATFPLLPQGSRGFFARQARQVNRLMPSDN